MSSIEKDERVKRGTRWWEYCVGILGVVVTIAMAVAVVFYWEEVRSLQGYGYLGAFVVSILGGATVLAPIPMTPIIFALGTVMKPALVPYLGPVFVGAAAGMGETLGGISIYMTGYGGGTPFLNSRYGKIQSAYLRLMDMMERRGSWTLFLLSGILNPFFYPAALTAGALRFGIRRYFLICWAGKTIKGISVALAGYWGLGGLLRLFGVPV